MTRPSPDPQNSATLLALFGLMLAGGFLLALTAMIMPAALGLLAVVFVFAAFSAFHYVLWGWWFAKRPRRTDDDED